MAFRGTSNAQDARFSNKVDEFKKILNFSRVLKKKIDFKKVKLYVLKEWITNRMIELMGFEDEIVINYVFSMLQQDRVDPKEMQIYLTGFMEENARVFMKDLWKLLDEAQKTPSGIPQRFIEEELHKIREEEKLKKKITEKIVQSSERRIDRGRRDIGERRDIDRERRDVGERKDDRRYLKRRRDDEEIESRKRRKFEDTDRKRYRSDDGSGDGDRYRRRESSEEDRYSGRDYKRNERDYDRRRDDRYDRNRGERREYDRRGGREERDHDRRREDRKEERVKPDFRVVDEKKRESDNKGEGTPTRENKDENRSIRKEWKHHSDSDEEERREDYYDRNRRRRRREDSYDRVRHRRRREDSYDRNRRRSYSDDSYSDEEERYRKKGRKKIRYISRSPSPEKWEKI